MVAKQRNRWGRSEECSRFRFFFFPLFLFFPHHPPFFRSRELTFLACWNEIKAVGKSDRSEYVSRIRDGCTHVTGASCFQTLNYEMRDAMFLSECLMQLLIVYMAKRYYWWTDHVSNIEFCVLWSFSHYFIVSKVWQDIYTYYTSDHGTTNRNYFVIIISLHREMVYLTRFSVM